MSVASDIASPPPEPMLPGADAVGRIVSEIAATVVMPYFAALGQGDIREKAPGDLVTVADVAAEKHLTAALTGLLPGSLVVGEEAAAADPAVLGALAGDELVWLVDPIDGTINFAAGSPLFAVMVALVRRGQTVMGLIHDPVRRSTAVAETGGGAWQDGRRLSVSAATPEAGPRFGNRRLARRLAGKSDAIDVAFDYRCAGHEYIALASGAVQFVLYNRLHPWDHAAGSLLHREAGGFGARLDGSPYCPRDTANGLLLAPDQASWNELHRALI
jgi:fructose-1,6-bisphosphatase/inositol monophosphatase family enzyme